VDKPVLDQSKSPKLDVEFPDSNIGNIAPKPTESNLQQPNPPVQQPSPNTMDYQKRLEG